MLKVFITLLVSLCASFAVAKPVQLDYQGLSINADYINHGTDKPIFVMLHGTWMHQTNDLPVYLQELIDYEGYSSLNISLSLGVDDRQQFVDCETTPTITDTHEQAVDELKIWFDWLSEQGHKRFILLGHSRGGAQSSLFYTTFRYPGLERLILLAPATYNQDKVAKSYENRYSTNLNDQLNYFKQLEDQESPLTETSILYCIFAKVSAKSFLSYYSPSQEKHTPFLLKSIDVPTTVFLGSEDNLSHEFNNYHSEFDQNSHVTIKWIEGADHFFRDFYADEIVEEVLNDLNN
ncbi:alpha/beta hydrolase [Reinekea forsetii]|nr:alpha/beta hydrolase [Reinekea forsetii]